MGMGGKDDTETKTKIKEKLTTNIGMKLKSKITNFTKNVNKKVTDNTIKVSNKMVNDFKSDTTAISIALNKMQDMTIMATGGSTVDWTQDASAKLTMAAIINILSSNEQKTDLANKVITELKAKIKNDSTLKSQLQQAAAIQKKAVDAKGFGNMVGNMVDKLTGMAEGMVQKLTGGSSTSKSDSEIETEVTKQISVEIENEVTNTTINTNDIVDKLSVDIKSSFTSMTEDSCLGTAESRNMAAKINALATRGSKIKVLQIAKSDAIAKCISTKKIGNKALTGLTNDNSYKSILDTSNKSSSDSKGKQVAKIKDIKENRDAINDSLDGAIKTIGGVAKEVVKEGGKTARMGMSVILLPVIIIGLIIVAVIGIKLASSAGDDGDDDDMDGGEIIDFAKFFDIPLAKRGLTLIIVF